MASFSLNRHAVCRVLVLLLLCSALLTLLPLTAVQAEAAGKYKVKHTHGGYDGMAAAWSWVSTSSPSADGPTFYSRPDDDSFINFYSGKDVRIRFYRAYELASKEQAKAMVDYLEAKGGKKYYAGWFSYYDPIFGGTSYCVYSVDGVDLSNKKLDTDKLINKNFWENKNGITMILHYVGKGDLRTSRSDWIRDELECSVAIYVKSDSNKGRTFGFSFYDWTRDDSLVWRYCSDEIW